MPEPEVRYEKLVERPSLADYVLKRRYLHDSRTIALAEEVVACQDREGGCLRDIKTRW